MDGSAEDKAVIVRRHIQKLVHLIVKDAGVLGGAGFAGNAAGEGLVADPEKAGADSLKVQRLCHRRQRGIGLALLMRAAIDQ